MFFKYQINAPDAFSEKVLISKKVSEKKSKIEKSCGASNFDIWDTRIQTLGSGMLFLE